MLILYFDETKVLKIDSCKDSKFAKELCKLAQRTHKLILADTNRLIRKSKSLEHRKPDKYNDETAHSR